VRAIRADRLAPWVWEDVSRLLSSPEIITAALRKAHAGELLQDDTPDRLRHLQQARLKAERQIERFVDAFTAEVVTLEALQTRRTGLQERIAVLTQQERDLRRQQHQQVRLTELSANIEELCAAIHSGLQTLDFSGRRKIMELLIDRVILSHEDIEIRYAIPLTGVNPTGKKETLRLPYRANLWLSQPASRGHHSMAEGP
jgi:site-specific DNA recombinase